VQLYTAVIPATWEVEIRRMEVPGQPWQKVNETTSQPISQAWWHAPVIPATRKATGRRVEV
jgi:hypothetical protein